jgi:chloramphenicol 3-O-phosphotransferase
MPNPTVVNSVSAAGTAVSITTASIASTSGNFIGVGVGNFVRDVGPTDVSDSKVNPWLVAFRQTGTGRSLVGLFYQPNIIGGAGHTFTNTPTGGSDVTTIGVIEFSGMPTNDSLDVTANRSVGVNIGGVTELNRSGATAFTNRPNSLLLGVATAPTTAPISKELFVDDISLANGAVEDVLFSWFITISAGTYNFKTSPANATQCAIASFKGTNIRVLQNKTAQAGGGSSSVTTAAITTTSGNFLAAGCTDFTQAISGTRISDSKTNTWQTARIETRIAMYYSENIIGGSGHTFTFTPNVADFLGLGIYEVSGNAKSFW